MKPFASRIACARLEKDGWHLRTSFTSSNIFFSGHGKARNPPEAFKLAKRCSKLHLDKFMLPLECKIAFSNQRSVCCAPSG